ncbi:MAG: EscU/YscU/HrcU family type III secretion system export apparatus switch protein, partial [Candidatus Cloacimonadota bacterium]|nr:EscU/YscU/HrcU family type III secretion system export apparatus switch protein [Candidatus Cloacimonadota bacterium]
KLKSLVKSIIKLVVLFSITYYIMKDEIDNIMNFVDLTIEQIFHEIARLVRKMLINVIYVYVAIAAIDYAVTRFLHFKKLKMTKHEVKDERKQMEGDPKIKQKIRRIMMEEAQKRMMKEVPESDVVITNPIHLAVAIKYNQQSVEAPIVVAKGKRLIAEKIKELARKNDIPIVENKMLARMLYKKSEIGEEIDVELYEAVAEVLAQIYKVKNKK